MLDLTVESIAALPVLLVATYRPEFQPPWVGQSQVTVIALNRLGRNEGATLVRARHQPPVGRAIATLVRPAPGRPSRPRFLFDADGDTLSGEEMQSIAAWTNLSETTFVCAPTVERADYRLRVFTPRRELPFAGHPTIGSAHATLRGGLKPNTPGRLVQECGRGLVKIKIDSGRLLLALPEPQFREPTEANLAAVADGLGVSVADVQRAAIIDVGPVWFTVQLASGDAVLAVAPDMGKLAALNSIGITGVNVFGLYPTGAGADLEARSFAPGDGIPEHPVCGSGNGCVAALVGRDGILKKRSYVATQGRCVGRDGRVAIEFDDGNIWLGGHAVTCIEGWLEI